MCGGTLPDVMNHVTTSIDARFSTHEEKYSLHLNTLLTTFRLPIEYSNGGENVTGEILWGEQFTAYRNTW